MIVLTRAAATASRSDPDKFEIEYNLHKSVSNRSGLHQLQNELEQTSTVTPLTANKW
jgi:hypothetical protein